MIRFIYNLFWPIGLLFFLPSYLVKMIRRGGYGEKFGQRLGIYDCEVCVRLSKQKPTWLHAVSVGEVNVALKLDNSWRPLFDCWIWFARRNLMTLIDGSRSALRAIGFVPLAASNTIPMDVIRGEKHRKIRE